MLCFGGFLNVPVTVKNKQTNKKTQKGGGMDDARIRDLRRAAAARPYDGNAQAELNAALSRCDIVRSLVHGEWHEAKRVFDARGVEIVFTSELRLLVDLWDAPLADLMADGHYEWANGLITQDAFAVEPGEGSQSVELIGCVGRTQTDHVLKWLCANGLRPATLKELLAFGAQYPAQQRRYRVLALGSRAVFYDIEHVPMLTATPAEYDHHEGRLLNLGYYINEWPGYHRFLAVRIDPSSAASQDVVADSPGTSAD